MITLVLLVFGALLFSGVVLSKGLLLVVLAADIAVAVWLIKLIYQKFKANKEGAK